MCGFIGAQAQIDTEKTGGKNPLVELALAIDVFGQPELDAIRGERVADDWRQDPRIAAQPADPDTGQEASNAVGSFEAFLGAFGSPPPAAAP